MEKVKGSSKLCDRLSQHIKRGQKIPCGLMHQKQSQQNNSNFTNTHQSRNMLQWFCKWNQQWIHPDPIVYVDVGQPVANHVMEKAQVQKAAFLPVDFGVRENKVQNRHDQDVDAQKNQHWEVHAGPEGVGEQDEDEQPSQDLEKNVKK